MSTLPGPVRRGPSHPPRRATAGGPRSEGGSPAHPPERVAASGATPPVMSRTLVRPGEAHGPGGGRPGRRRVRMPGPCHGVGRPRACCLDRSWMFRPTSRSWRWWCGETRRGTAKASSSPSPWRSSWRPMAPPMACRVSRVCSSRSPVRAQVTATAACEACGRPAVSLRGVTAAGVTVQCPEVLVVGVEQEPRHAAGGRLAGVRRVPRRGDRDAPACRQCRRGTPVPRPKGPGQRRRDDPGARGRQREPHVPWLTAQFQPEPCSVSFSL